MQENLFLPIIYKKTHILFLNFENNILKIIFLNNIHFNDINYKKYVINLKNDDGYHSGFKRIKKKNYSLNKNIITPDTYNVIQIYEAPPLELNPIM